MIHDEIVDDVRDLYRRGHVQLTQFTENRLIRQVEGIDDTMKKVPRLSELTSRSPRNVLL